MGRRIQSITHSVEVRGAGGREATPAVAIVGSQGVKSAQKSRAGIDSKGCDAGKKIKDKKRHILLDTTGSLLKAPCAPLPISKIVTAAFFSFRSCSGRFRC